MLVLKFILQYFADIITQGIMVIFLMYCTRNPVTKSVTICMANQKWIHGGPCIIIKVLSNMSLLRCCLRKILILASLTCIIRGVDNSQEPGKIPRCQCVFLAEKKCSLFSYYPPINCHFSSVINLSVIADNIVGLSN